MVLDITMPERTGLELAEDVDKLLPELQDPDVDGRMRATWQKAEWPMLRRMAEEAAQRFEQAVPAGRAAARSFHDAVEVGVAGGYGASDLH